MGTAAGGAARGAPPLGAHAGGAGASDGVQGALGDAPAPRDGADVAGRRPHLEGLRGAAVLMVLLVHLVAPVSPLGHGGYLGVDVFLVLSGYLITAQLRTHRPRYRDFVRRRAVRLLPAYAATVLGGTVLALAVTPCTRWHAVARGAVAAAAMLMWVLACLGPTHSPLAHTWSLAVEWIFYMVWPPVVALLGRHDPRRCARWLALASVVLFMLAQTLPFRPYYFGPVHRFAELCLGAAVAYLPEAAGGRLVTPRRLALVGAAVGLWGLAGAGAHTALARWVVVPVAVVWTAALVQHGRTRPVPGLGHPLLRGLGRASYSVYLWHFVLMQTVAGPHGTPAAGAVVAVVVPATVVVGLVSYRLFEVPALRRGGAVG